TSGSLLRKKSAAEPNVSTLRLTERNRLLSASRIDSSSSTTNTIGSSAVAGWRDERSITRSSPDSRPGQPTESTSTLLIELAQRTHAETKPTALPRMKRIGFHGSPKTKVLRPRSLAYGVNPKI